LTARAALFSRIASVLTMDMAGMIAWATFAHAPWATAFIAGIVTLKGLRAWKEAKKQKAAVHLMRAALYKKLHEGEQPIDPASLPGETAIQKRYWSLLTDENGKPKLGPDGKPTPIASFWDSYRFGR